MSFVKIIVWRHVGVVVVMAMPLVVTLSFNLESVAYGFCVLWPYTVGVVSSWRGWLNV